MDNHELREEEAVPPCEGIPAGSLRTLSEVELVARVASACREERRLTADVVACLVEVDRRRLHSRASYSSLFDYCTRHLGMSGGAAYRRINAVRLVQAYPCLLPRLARGDLHLCGLLVLREHFTKDNVEELASAASGLSEGKLRELLAARSPRPPVPERIRPAGVQAPLPVVSPAPPPSSSYTAPLSPTMYELQLTIAADTHAKLRRAQDMMRHRQPDGDLAVVIDRAVDALLVQLERQCLAKAERPRAGKATKGVSRATRRAVFERDGQQCTYRSEAGDRCPAIAFLELDHQAAQGFGGGHDLANLRVLCHAHNHLHAEDDFGEKMIASCVEASRARPKAASAPGHRASNHGGGDAEMASVMASAADAVRSSCEPADAPAPVAPAVPVALAPASDATARAERERMTVYGLNDLGFARADCIATARAILDRSAVDRPLGDVLREAIMELASRP